MRIVRKFTIDRNNRKGRTSVVSMAGRNKITKALFSLPLWLLAHSSSNVLAIWIPQGISSSEIISPLQLKRYRLISVQIC